MQTQFLININNPILKNHKVYGQEILPGLAYIDMLFQLFRENGHDHTKLELRNLTIYNPLTVSQDHSVLLTIEYTQTPQHNWKIRIEGEEQRNGKITTPKKLYITAEMHTINTISFNETLDISTLQQVKNTLELEDVYKRFRAQDLIHTGFIKAEGKIYNTDSARIINISIGEEALPSSEEFMFHPTLIDGCAVGSMDVFEFVTKGEERLYIPLFYESFRAAELFNKHCITRVQTSSVRGREDILYMTIEFFNLSGKKIGEMKNFATKLVREQGLINRNRKAETQSVKQNEPAKLETAELEKAQTSSTESPAEAENFLRELLAERLRRPANQIDLQAGYYEMGLDSPGLLEIVQGIENKIGTSLSPTLLFEYTTITALADYLSEEYPDKFGSITAEQQVFVSQTSDSEAEENTSEQYSFGNQYIEQINREQEDIAVIGLACRYPKASNPQEFWENLKEASDLVTEIPKSRWDWQKYDNITSPSGKHMSRWGGFIDNHDCFDPHFFRISPREAELIDPQERLFLEACWEAIEDAGYTPNNLVSPRGQNKRRPVGVFAGVMHKDYTLIEAEAVAKKQAFVLSLNCAQIANRVSYFCNFHGPSMAVDTVCSSSLTALHLALESIKRGECEVALAGAVNLSLHPIKYISVGMIDMHSTDGHCRTFGKGGDGYVSGEGIGVVLLKPLSKAIKDKDNIYGVIKGSSINHVGTVSGITVPSPVAHAEMIVDCLKKTNINPRTISYMEAHGTGTSLGDPIEIQGLTKAYRQFTQDVQFCSIGSVKSNFGHAESAAGISGLHKVIMQLHHKTLVPSLHSDELNPYLNLEQSPFYVQHKTEKWKQPVIIENGKEAAYPRRAAISSFGATGSNGHVILEEYIPDGDMQQAPLEQARLQDTKEKAVIVPLSAKNGERLQAYAQKLLKFLKELYTENKPKESKADIRRKLQDIVETKLAKLLAEVLSVEENVIEANQEWSEYGLDPVHITQLKDKLKEQLSIEISLNELNQKSSVASVAISIINNNNEVLEALVDLSSNRNIDSKEAEVNTNKREIKLNELAYTFQVGREAMEERAAFLVKDIPELINKLEAFVEDTTIDNCWKGHIKRNKETIDLFGTDQDAAELIRKWIAKGNLKKIAELWAKGYAVDWELFYKSYRPRRISLPTYPFAMEHYWVPEAGNEAGSNQLAAPMLHPLLHSNTSDFYEQRYSSSFSGSEIFLADHIIKGQKVLPGVAYIEMARAAVAQALGLSAEEQTAIRLKNITWIRPIVVQVPTNVNIGLYPEENGEIAFEIYTMNENNEAIICCQGSALQIMPSKAIVLDIKAIEQQCDKEVFEASQCYDIFRQVGLEYGTAHKGIEKLFTEQNKVLTKLLLPYSISQTLEEYILHPSLMDSALQGTIGFGTDYKNIKSSLPFELQQLDIYSKCTQSMWAYVRYSEGSGSDQKLEKFDIDLCNEAGTVCVSLKGFSTRAMEALTQAVNVKSIAADNTASVEPLVGKILMTPVWDKVSAEKGESITANEKVVIIGGTEDNINAIKQYYPQAAALELKPESTMEEIADTLKAYETIEHIIWIAPYKAVDTLTDYSIVEDQQKGLYQLLRTAKAVISMGYDSRKLCWTVITTSVQPVHEDDYVNPAHAAVHGLVGSMAKEVSSWKIRLADLQADKLMPAKDILELPYDSRKAHPWVYRDNQWYKRQLLPIYNNQKINTAYRKEGVYVVIGGAGDIGEVWSEYMIRTYQAKVIWIGRRKKDAAIQAKIDRLSKLGTPPYYISADATDSSSLQKALEEIKAVYPQINGLVHAALVLKDQIVAEVQEDKFKTVLSTKVDICVSMAKVFDKEKLDFVLFFSSIISFIKNPGQSNYAAGCTFKDSFAHQLSKEWSCKVKVMNWGFWYKEESASPETYQIYLRLTEIGMGAIEAPEAMEALEMLLAGPVNQLALMKTTKPLIIEGLNTTDQITVDNNGTLHRSKRVNSKPAPITNQQLAKNTNIVNKEKAALVQKPVEVKKTGITTDIIREKTTAYIKQVVGEILKIQSNKIDSSEPLERYGIDSIVIVQLTNSLRRVLDNINSTLFFEYQTIDALVEHFVKTRKDALIDLLGLEEKEESAVETEISSTAETSSLAQPINNTAIRRQKRFISHSQESSKGGATEQKLQDIAIIGLSGRYAKADNVNEFWNNLSNGINCITEVPEDRWDWRDFYHEEKGRKGSTYTKWGGFIRDIDKFDPLFFQISPKEAAEMDPQERLFLEAVYESIEDSGYTPSNLCDNRKIGIFAGVMYGQYPTGAKYWSIANRISYLFNFQGPSMSIDTACSSSLTAVHLALESLYSGISECAIAGGVNLIVSPEHMIGLSEMTMLSPGDKCKAFGEKADGFVDGEGVGAIVLKPLQKAIEAGDHIYGIIKGSMLNTAGKTNGYTVPSPTVQYQLVKEAINRADVNARTISYIEAHGTGTALGDPIEISGLTKAFEHYTSDKQFCAIGSAKSNIGHCESAAGIAAITKVLMQLKHGKLVPSLHSKDKNPNIDFSSTPFAVQQELTEWKRPVIEINGITKEYPRIAGISSFGAGGSNAHLIIEEYMPQQQTCLAVSSANPAIIVLSAKSEDRLLEQAKRLLTAIDEVPLEDSHLANIAYTLQTGREAMEERLALIVTSIKELKEKLMSFTEADIKTQQGIADLYRGQVKGNKEMLTVFAADDDMSSTVDTWISKGKYSKLMELWVKGMNLDWNKLYGESRPQRISLPTYPFARERYWVEKAEYTVKAGDVTLLSNSNVLHPLLHQNTSDLSQQCYRTVFSGQEFFLTDHIVKGQHMLPGVVYLEMARAAAEAALGSSVRKAVKDNAMKLNLKNIVWQKPITAEKQPVAINVRIIPDENGELIYEIYSNSSDGEETVHGQGRIVTNLDTDAPVCELDMLKAECSQGILTDSQCYGAFKTIGIEYGPAHMGIQEIYMGSEQVLAKLSLPEAVKNTYSQYVMHPSIMDSALQATIGLMISSGCIKPALPFALQQLEIYNSCTSEMWAFVRYSENSSSEDIVQKFDIDLINESGSICIRLKKFSIRVIDEKSTSEDLIDKADEIYGSTILKPCWEQENTSLAVEMPIYENQLAVICELDNISKEQVESIGKISCIKLNEEQGNVQDRYQAYAVQIFEVIQKLLNNKPNGNVLVQIAVPNCGEQQVFAGLNGMLKTARLENPKLIGQLIQLDKQETTEGLISKLKENQRCSHNKHIKYEKGKRYVSVWKELHTSQKDLYMPWKDNGVYLISGGAGSLGLVFANEIADKARGAKLILTGRSAINDSIQLNIEKLKNLGANAEYKQVDVTDKKAVNNLIKNIIQSFGQINGIIHTAGFIRDSFIIKKTREEFLEVLAPKVMGMMNLDEASQELELDLFVCFSSVAGAVGNPGQADYSAANAYMDVYASYRNELVQAGKRKGRTISINWPLWKDGGIHVDQETENTMLQIMGTIPMKTSTGIKALYKSLLSDSSQVMVMEGNVERFNKIIAEQQPKAPSVRAAAISQLSPTAAEDMLKEKAADYFKKLLSSVIGLPANRIEADAYMDKYGIDSIMIMKMTNQLEKVFGSLSKTLFFEYQSIDELTAYFIKEHNKQLKELLGVKEQQTEPPAIEKNIEAEAVRPVQGFNSKQRFAVQASFTANSSKTKEKQQENMDIAIVGVSGRYPGARNLREYWENLKSGVDSITEIPKERWDHSLYFDEDKNKAGKTYSKWGGFIDGVDQFDPRFFSISPREAETLDPQEKLFLQCVYETLEDAGHTRESLSESIKGNVGVFLGTMYTEYQLYGVQETLMGRPIALAGSPASIANRISYFCNFHGPSIAVDTMCSSSLTTIHLACQAIQNGDCQAAIAGGVNVSIHPNKYLLLAQGKFASSKGRCESFGLGGDGYVPGEGVGAIMLKPLSKAIEDRDQIYGVIKASALNHGGRTNGYTVPNPNAQAGVIAKAIKVAGINPRIISYIEAHGTGTSLGDPIEIAGLTKTFNEYTKDKQYCAIGSAKSNIGHCEGAAGIAGVTKILLQMKYRQLVPSLHSKTLNPNIDFSSTPFVVQQQLSEWKRPVVNIDGSTKEYPRTAGISAFGAGGANAHIIIQEYTGVNKNTSDKLTIDDNNPAVIVMSARNEARLKEQAQQLITAINEQQYTDKDLADMAYTLQAGREAMDERLAMLASSIEQLKQKLEAYVEGQSDISDFYRGQVKPNKEALAVFAVDEELKEAVDKWIQRKKYSKLLELWSKGLNVDWEKLYANAKPNRISMPTYPFAKERYWVPENKNKTINIAEAPKPAPKEEIKPEVTKVTEQYVIKAEKSGITDSKQIAVILQKPANIADIIEEAKTLEKPRGILLSPIYYSQPSEAKPESNISIDTKADSDNIAEHLKNMDFDDILKLVQEGKLDIEKAEELLLQLAAASQEPETQEAETQSSPVQNTKEKLEKPVCSITAEILQRELITSLAEALYMSDGEIDIDEKFIDMGLDSITGVEWIQKINKTYGAAVSATKVYDYPTIREFTDYLQGELAKLGKSEPKSVSEVKTSDSFDDIINQVQTGQMDIEEAEKLLLQLTPQNSELTAQESQIQELEFQNTIEEPKEPAGDITPEVLQSELITSLAEALYMSDGEIDIDEKFIDMGLDSITGVEWIQKINKAYGVSVSATKVYDYPTIREFAGYLLKELAKSR